MLLRLYYGFGSFLIGVLGDLRIIRLPHDSTLQFQRQGDNIYVFKREYYFLGNVRKESRRYIGKVKDGRFYTMTEYKEKFDRYGRKRVKRNKAVPQT